MQDATVVIVEMSHHPYHDITIYTLFLYHQLATSACYILFVFVFAFDDDAAADVC